MGTAGEREARVRARRTTVWTIAVVALLGGCSSASEPDEDVEPDPFQALVSAELGESQGVLGELRSRRGQERLAECVRAAGFEYFPDSSESVVVDLGDEQEYEETLRSQGWGYFTQPGVPEDFEVQEPTEQIKYELSLSPSAQEEYDRVMHGEVDPATGGRVPGTGCFEKAYGEDADAPETAFAELLAEINDAWLVAEEEPEVRKARDTYRECLSRAGFPGVTKTAYELLEERFNEEFPNADYAMNDPRLPELAKFEISLANAHLDCEKESEVHSVAARATARIEAEILERRAKELAAYIEAVREFYELD